MTPHESTVLDASASMLRVIGALVAVLNPVKGTKATTLRALAEDVEDIEKEHGESLSSHVRQLLSSAVSTLSSSATSTVPYADCLPAQLALSQALPLLLVLPLPALSPFLRLPAELVTRIVNFCQFDDLRLRQNTNLALSRSCHLFRPYTTPILATEMHLFTAGQVERSYALSTQEGSPLRAVKSLTIDVTLDDMARHSGESWAGCRIPTLIDNLLRQTSLSSLHLHVRPASSLDVGAAANDAEKYERNLMQALALDDYGWDLQYRNLADLYLPGIGVTSAYDLLFKPFPFLRRLRIGTSSPPRSSRLAGPEHHHGARCQYKSSVQAYRSVQGGSPQPLEVLAVPYHLFFPSDLLPLVLPPFLSAPILTHLEVAFRLRDVLQDCGTIADILRRLAPTLSHLTLRVQCPDVQQFNIQTYEATVTPVLRTCTKLEHLEVGGNCVDYGFVHAASHLPRLQKLVILPCPEADHFGLLSDFDHLPPSLRSLVFYVPPLSSTGPYDMFSNHYLYDVMSRCEGGSVALEFREDVAEAEWVRTA